MATNTGGGTTTSLDNTPQAKDDFYTANEDEVLYFSVMANDLGGSAKVLWSIDNTSDDGSGDLVAKDVAGVCEYSELGAKISLTSDGRIRYDTTMLDSLAAGQTVTDQFTYAIRLSNGTLSWATVTVTLSGTNDAPDIFVSAGDSASANLDETNAPLTASGTLSVVDVDTTDVVDTAVTGLAVSGNQGTLTNAQLTAMLSLTGANDLAANSGDANNLGWNFSSDPQAFDFLAEGQSLTLTYTLTSTDNFGASDTQTVTITVTGTNDDPVALADEADVDEDGNTSGSVATNDSDPDAGAVLGYALDNPGSAPTGLVFNADGSWTFDASSYDYLDEGEELELVIPYTVTDEHGASDSSTLTITVTGTNDDPVALADEADVDEDGNTSGCVATNDSDPDAGAVLGYALDNPGSAPTGLVFNADGSWTFDASSYDYLDEGEELELVIPYTVTDEHGASDSSTLTITVTGTNDAPLLTGTQATLPAGTEDTSYIVSAASLLAGFTDADGDTLAVFALSADHGSVTDNGNGTYTINPAADYNGLVTLSYSVVDGNGGSVPASLSFNLAAVNDPAVIAGPITGTVVEATPADPGTPTASGTLTAADVDNPPNTFIAVASTATATGYGSYTMSASGLWTYTLNNANATVNALATGAFLIDTFTVQSADGTTQTITVTINGATDAVVVTPPTTFTGTGDTNDNDLLVGSSSPGFLLVNGTNVGETLTGDTSANDKDIINGFGGDDTTMRVTPPTKYMAAPAMISLTGATTDTALRSGRERHHSW